MLCWIQIVSSIDPSCRVKPFSTIPTLGTPQFPHTRTAPLWYYKVLPEAYKDYADVFDEKEAGLLPDHGLYELAIELIKGKQPPFSPLYNLLEAELKVLREYLDKNLQRG